MIELNLTEDLANSFTLETAQSQDHKVFIGNHRRSNMQELGRTGRKPSVPESPRLGMKSDHLNWRTVPHPGHQTALDSPGKGRRQTTPEGN